MEKCNYSQCEKDVARGKRYCSDECVTLKIMETSQKKIDIDKQKNRRCTMCNNDIPLSRNVQAKTCSDECGIKLQRQTVKNQRDRIKKTKKESRMNFSLKIKKAEKQKPTNKSKMLKKYTERGEIQYAGYRSL